MIINKIIYHFVQLADSTALCTWDCFRPSATQNCYWHWFPVCSATRCIMRWGNLGRRRPAIIDNSRPWGLVLSAILGTDREHFVFEKLYSFHCENLNKTKLRQLKMYETNTWIVNHNKNIYEIYLSIMKYIIKKLKYQSNIRKMSVTIIILKLLLLMFKWHDFDNQFG